MNTGKGEPVAKGLAAGAVTILRIVKDSQVLSEEDFATFEMWIRWLHDCRSNDRRFLELCIEPILPPILKSANATALFDNLDQDTEMGVDAIRLVQLAIRLTRNVTRFETIISGLAERLLASERGCDMNTQTLTGTPQSRAGSMPQIA